MESDSPLTRLVVEMEVERMSPAQADMHEPSTSSNWPRPLVSPPTATCKPLVVGMEVERTPSGTLRVMENVLLEKTPLGSVRPWRPTSLVAGENVEIVGLEPVNLFPDEDIDHNDEGNFDAAFTQLLPDSGSEAGDDELEEELTLGQLREALDDDLLNERIDEVEAVAEPALSLPTNFEWSEDYSTFTGIIEDFNEEVGPKFEATSPFAVFSQIWDQTIMESIVQSTNKYAWETIAQCAETEDGIAPKSRLNSWEETSVGEMYRLIALIVLMSMCVRNRIDEYWSTGVLGMTEFRKIMSINRYLLLLKFLHFVDNSTIDMDSHGAERKLSKIKHLLDFLNKKFQDIYVPRRELSLDESLLLWKGRLSWRQCIRTKAARFGIKSYELCEAVTGYVLNIMIYTGKTTSLQTIFGFNSSTEKIVLYLFEKYLIYTFNSYISLI